MSKTSAATNGKKGSHFVFNRYIPTPTEKNELEDLHPAVQSEERTVDEHPRVHIQGEATEHPRLQFHDEITEIKENVNFVSDSPVPAKPRSRAKTAGSTRSRPKTGQTKSAKSARSRKSRPRSDTELEITEETRETMEASVDRKLREILHSDGGETDFSEGYTDYSEEGDDFSDEDGPREVSTRNEEDDHCEITGPRGVSRERTRELKSGADTLNFTPKFITAADCKVLGNASDYDTDIELQDTQAILEKGRVSIYEGTGRTMYEATCKMEGAVPISSILERLENKLIVMRRHYLSPKDAVCLANGFKYNTMVEELDLIDNHMGPVGGAAFAEMVVKNKFILRLNLADNSLGNQGIFPFWKALDAHDNLQSLVLRNNGISKTGMHAFAKALKHNHGLQVLDLSGNAIEITGATEIFNALTANESLFHLDLSWNRIQGDKLWKLMAKWLKVNNSLEILNLARNGTGDRILSLTFKQFKKQAGIKMLDLSSNRLTLVGIKKLCAALVKNTTLEVIRLSNNQIGDEGITWLLKKLMKNLTVRVVCLENIRISPEMMRTIAELQKEHTQFIIVYGTGHDIGEYVPPLISKIESYMASYGINAVDLYFQKPSATIPAASVTKVVIDGTSNSIATESVVQRLTLLNINFSMEQVERLLAHLGASSARDPRRDARPREEWEEPPEDEVLFPLNAWEPKSLKWCEAQLRMLTADVYSGFVWDLHCYILYLRSGVTPTHEQQSNLLDCRLLKLLTLRHILLNLC